MSNRGDGKIHVPDHCTDSTKIAVPDRVTDAPIPERWLHVYEQRQIMSDSSSHMICMLIREVARLEAEKQEAHTEGWNAAIEEASGAAGQFWDEDDALQIDRITAAIHGLSKPTAAKQGEPS